jgi:ABC-type multidrug transport system ATPase subunit
LRRVKKSFALANISRGNISLFVISLASLASQFWNLHAMELKLVSVSFATNQKPSVLRAVLNQVTSNESATHGQEQPEILLLNNVSTCFNSGTINVITGMGSAHKSLLECISLRHTSGSMKGKVLIDSVVRKIGVYRDIAFISDCGRIHTDNLTVFDYLYFGARLRIAQDELECRERARLACRAVGLDPYTIVLHLCEVDRRALNIAVELVGYPTLIVLDSPLSGLDAAGVLHVMKILRAVAKRSGMATTVVLSAAGVNDDVLALLDTLSVFIGNTLKYTYTAAQWRVPGESHQSQSRSQSQSQCQSHIEVVQGITQAALIVDAAAVVDHSVLGTGVFSNDSDDVTGLSGTANNSSGAHDVGATHHYRGAYDRRSGRRRGSQRRQLLRMEVLQEQKVQYNLYVAQLNNLFTKLESIAADAHSSIEGADNPGRKNEQHSLHNVNLEARQLNDGNGSSMVRKSKPFYTDLNILLSRLLWCHYRNVRRFTFYFILVTRCALFTFSFFLFLFLFLFFSPHADIILANGIVAVRDGFRFSRLAGARKWLAFTKR